MSTSREPFGRDRILIRIVRDFTKTHVKGLDSPAEDSEEIAFDSHRSQCFERQIAFDSGRSRATQGRSRLFWIDHGPSKTEALGFESAAANPNQSSSDVKVPRVYSRELASDSKQTAIDLNGFDPSQNFPEQSKTDRNLGQKSQIFCLTSTTSKNFVTKRPSRGSSLVRGDYVFVRDQPTVASETVR
jgi:hypothetical protein